MKTYEVPGLSGLPPDEARERVAALASACGLRTTSFGTLATDPGSMHWHFKLGNGPGVLELTISPRKGQAFLAVHDNRIRPWIGPKVEEFLGKAG